MILTLDQYFEYIISRETDAPSILVVLATMMAIVLTILYIVWLVKLLNKVLNIKKEEEQ